MSIPAAIAEAQRRFALTAAVQQELAAVRADLRDGTIDVEALPAGAPVRAALADAAAAESIARLALAVARLNAARAPALLERLQAEAAEQEMLISAGGSEQPGGDEAALAALEASLRRLVAAAADGKTVRVRRSASLDDARAALYANAAAAGAAVSRRPLPLVRSRSTGSTESGGAPPAWVANPPPYDDANDGLGGFDGDGGEFGGFAEPQLSVGEGGLWSSRSNGSGGGDVPPSATSSRSGGARDAFALGSSRGSAAASGEGEGDEEEEDGEDDPLMADDLLDLGVGGKELAASGAASSILAGSKRPREGDAGEPLRGSSGGGDKRGSGGGGRSSEVFDWDPRLLVWDHVRKTYVAASRAGEDGDDDAAPPDTSESWRDH